MAFYLHNKLFATSRPRILLFNQVGQILLVKSWLNSARWELPGGGIKKTEQPRDAACRELREETGIIVRAENLQYIGTFKRTFTAPIFTTTIDSRHATLELPLEIIDAQWSDPNGLPAVSWCVTDSLAKLASRE